MMMTIASTHSNIFDIDFTYVMMIHRASETCTSLFVHFTICMLFEADNKLRGLDLLGHKQFWVVQDGVLKHLSSDLQYPKAYLCRCIYNTSTYLLCTPRCRLFHEINYL